MDLDLLDYAQFRGFGEIHIKVDRDVNLRAIIAIHNTNRGPALGGCRCLSYPSSNAAIYDAMRLARAMSYKSALVDLPFGGGKSVLIKPKEIPDRKAYFEAFGKMIEALNGKYITAIDSGTTVEDMDLIHSSTKYVSCLTSMNGETSLYTARGVMQGIQAALEFKHPNKAFSDCHVAIQGVGSVGYFLVRELAKQGVKMTISDVDAKRTKQCQEEFGVDVVATDDIYSIECDVFSPCALGAILNDATIPKIRASIIAGSANNQLAKSCHGKQLHSNEKLYAPDFVINAGGLIYAAARYTNMQEIDINQRLTSIHDTVYSIFERSASENQPSSEIANAIAEEKL